MRAKPALSNGGRIMLTRWMPLCMTSREYAGARKQSNRRLSVSISPDIKSSFLFFMPLSFCHHAVVRLHCNEVPDVRGLFGVVFVRADRARRASGW